MPPASLLIEPIWLRYVVASALAFAPIFFANLVFTYSFRDTKAADMAFASNLLGAVVGGAIEYVALITGYGWLLVIVAGLYADLMCSRRCAAGRSRTLSVAGRPRRRLLFVPFVFLPALVWWAIPLGITLAVLIHLRPSIVVWPLMAACLGWQPAHIHIVSGNPVIWAMAAVALGTVYKWPSVFALIKPSLFVFALFGVRNRAWWFSLGLFALLCVPFATHVAGLADGRPEFARRWALLLVAGSPATDAPDHRVARQTARTIWARGASDGGAALPAEVQVAQ